MDFTRKFIKRNLDIRILKYEKIEITNNTAKQIATLQEGIDRELAKNISTLIKKSKLKVQSSIQGDSIRVLVKKEILTRCNSIYKRKEIFYSFDNLIIFVD